MSKFLSRISLHLVPLILKSYEELKRAVGRPLDSKWPFWRRRRSSARPAAAATVRGGRGGANDGGGGGKWGEFC